MVRIIMVGRNSWKREFITGKRMSQCATERQLMKIRAGPMLCTMSACLILQATTTISNLFSW